MQIRDKVSSMGKDTAKLRRYEDDLYVSGVGAMVMGIWSVIKLVMQIFLKGEDYLGLKDLDQESGIGTVIVLKIISVILVLIVLALHFYIGLNAIRSAKGKPHKKGYTVVAVVFMVLTVLGMYDYREGFNATDFDTTFASMLVDLTTVYIFFSVIISTFRINKLKEMTLG